jgi:hypothetical protein
VEPLAVNLCIGKDTPNDKLTLLFIASKCGIIEIEGENAKYVDDMMVKNATTGHIEGNVNSMLNDPEFLWTNF